MTQPFLIVGLPRSRTAWLSTAATAERTICFHEPTAWLDRWEDIFDKVWMERASRDYVGIADHGLGFHLPEIIRRAGPRTLIVERPIAEVDASLARMGLPPSNFCALLHKALAYQHTLIRRVSYASLQSTSVVVACLRWLAPGARFDAERIMELQAMNVQVDLDAALSNAARRVPDLHKLLPADVLAQVRLG